MCYNGNWDWNCNRNSYSKDCFSSVKSTQPTRKAGHVAGPICLGNSPGGTKKKGLLSSSSLSLENTPKDKIGPRFVTFQEGSEDVVLSVGLETPNRYVANQVLDMIVLGVGGVGFFILFF